MLVICVSHPPCSNLPRKFSHPNLPYRVKRVLQHPPTVLIGILLINQNARPPGAECPAEQSGHAELEISGEYCLCTSGIIGLQRN